MNNAYFYPTADLQMNYCRGVETVIVCLLLSNVMSHPRRAARTSFQENIRKIARPEPQEAIFRARATEGRGHADAINSNARTWSTHTHLYSAFVIQRPLSNQQQAVCANPGLNAPVLSGGFSPQFACGCCSLQMLLITARL